MRISVVERTIKFRKGRLILRQGQTEVWFGEKDQCSPYIDTKLAKHDGFFIVCG
jgi:hypothetical protein